MRYYFRPMGIGSSHKKWAIRVCVVALLFYAAYASYVVWAMRQPPETFARVMSHMPGPAVFLTLVPVTSPPTSHSLSWTKATAYNFLRSPRTNRWF